MQAAHGAPLDRTAALLERAFRLALALNGHMGPRAAEDHAVPAGVFAEFVIARELVALLDEARVSLLSLRTERPAPSDDAGVA